MSECIELSMAKVKDELEAYHVAMEFLKALKSNAKEHLINNQRAIEWQIFKGSNVNVLAEKLFMVRFVYWPKYNLVAAIGQKYPDECRKILPLDFHYQNSADQNYDYEIYSGLGFEEVIERSKNLSPDEILQNIDYLEADDLAKESNLEYWRKTTCYKNICLRELSLEKVIYERDSDNYIAFTMSALKGEMDYEKNVHPFLRTVFNAIAAESM